MVAILAHGLSALPSEACGLWGQRVGGEVCLWPAANVAPSALREARFTIEPLLLMRLLEAEDRGEVRLCGMYHSHPSGPPFLSAEDQEGFALQGRAWKKDVAMLVLSLVPENLSAVLYVLPQPSSLRWQAVSFWRWHRSFGEEEGAVGVDPISERLLNTERDEGMEILFSETDAPEGR